MSVRKINRLESFRHAFSGIWYTFRTQRNAQIHLIIAVAVFVLGLVLKLKLTDWAILTLTTGLVISVEMLNTVAEAAMDYATAEFNPQVKIVKDVAAGAVLMAAITAVLVGLLVLGPPLVQRLSSFFSIIRLSN